jgi:arsenate reductase (glutaredoxin)
MSSPSVESTPRGTVVCWGIPNCDTVKRVRAALAQDGWQVDFRDFKKLGAPLERLQAWDAAVGWEALLNRRGTTWRGLDAATQALASDRAGTLRLLQAHTSLIRRPVLEWPDGRISVGPPA